MISSEVEIDRLELPRQLKKESSKMKVNFFTEKHRTPLNYRCKPDIHCVGVPRGPSETDDSDCMHLEATYTTGITMKWVKTTFYENKAGTRLCSRCAKHWPNHILAQSKWRKGKTVSELQTRLVDHQAYCERKKAASTLVQRRRKANRLFVRRIKQALEKKYGTSKVEYALFLKSDKSTIHRGLIWKYHVGLGQLCVKDLTKKTSVYYQYSGVQFYCLITRRFDHPCLQRSFLRGVEAFWFVNPKDNC